MCQEEPGEDAGVQDPGQRRVGVPQVRQEADQGAEDDLLFSIQGQYLACIFLTF